MSANEINAHLESYASITSDRLKAKRISLSDINEQPQFLAQVSLESVQAFEPKNTSLLYKAEHRTKHINGSVL